MASALADKQLEMRKRWVRPIKLRRNYVRKISPKTFSAKLDAKEGKEQR